MGYKTGLLDADVYGPNVPLMMHTSQQPRVLNENLIEPLQNFGVKIISVGFLNPGDKPIVWRGPMLHQIIRSFCNRWCGENWITLSSTCRRARATLSFRSSRLSRLRVPWWYRRHLTYRCRTGRKAIEMFRTARVDLLGLVENMSHFLCPALPPGNRYLLQGRSGTHGAAVRRALFRID